MPRIAARTPDCDGYGFRAEFVVNIDFAVHDAGPATTWALAASPGQVDHRRRPAPDQWGPAPGGSLRAGVPVTTIVVNGRRWSRTFGRLPTGRRMGVYRQGEHADDATLLRRARGAWQAPQGEGYVWIAAEARVAKSLRDVRLDDRCNPKSWLNDSGYWVNGQADAAERLDP